VLVSLYLLVRVVFREPAMVLGHPTVTQYSFGPEVEIGYTAKAHDKATLGAVKKDLALSALVGVRRAGID